MALLARNACGLAASGVGDLPDIVWEAAAA